MTNYHPLFSSYLSEVEKIANQQVAQAMAAGGMGNPQSAAYPMGVSQPSAQGGGMAPGGAALYAKGGIVKKPTNAIVGEDGPEAIIPLTKRKRARIIAKRILKETRKK